MPAGSTKSRFEIYLSIIQHKVLTPNDLRSLAKLLDKLRPYTTLARAA